MTTELLGQTAHAIIWQPDPEEAAAEQPIVVRIYTGSGQLGLEQRDSHILIQPETVPELIRQLRAVVRKLEQVREEEG